MPTGRGFELLGGVKIKSIQRGTATLSSTSPTNVSISSVDTSKTMVRCTTRGAGDSARDYIDLLVTARLTSSTNLELDKDWHLTGYPTTVEWEVIEFESGVSVQRGLVSKYLSNSSYVDVTISSVNTAKSFINFSQRVNNQPGGYSGTLFITATFYSSTTVRFSWDSIGTLDPNPLKYIAWEVISWQ